MKLPEFTRVARIVQSSVTMIASMTCVVAILDAVEQTFPVFSPILLFLLTLGLEYENLADIFHVDSDLYADRHLSDG